MKVGQLLCASRVEKVGGRACFVRVRAITEVLSSTPSLLCWVGSALAVLHCGLPGCLQGTDTPLAFALLVISAVALCTECIVRGGEDSRCAFTSGHWHSIEWRDADSSHPAGVSQHCERFIVPSFRVVTPLYHHSKQWLVSWEIAGVAAVSEALLQQWQQLLYNSGGL